MQTNFAPQKSCLTNFIHTLELHKERLERKCVESVQHELNRAIAESLHRHFSESWVQAVRLPVYIGEYAIDYEKAAALNLLSDEDSKTKDFLVDTINTLNDIRRFLHSILTTYTHIRLCFPFLEPAYGYLCNIKGPFPLECQYDLIPEWTIMIKGPLNKKLKFKARDLKGDDGETAAAYGKKLMTVLNTMTLLDDETNSWADHVNNFKHEMEFRLINSVCCSLYR